MIEDKIQVLKTFSDEFMKIWLCDDEKKICGTRKHQSGLYEELNHATNWQQVIRFIDNF